MLAYFFPPPEHDCEKETQSSTDAHPCQNHIAKSSGESLATIWERTWDDPIAFNTFVLSIFTASLIIVGAVQGYYIRAAVRSDEESRRTLQRTYVSGGGTVIDRGTRFQINVHNHGGTAARLRWIWYGFSDWDDFADAPVPPYSARLPWLDSIGPGKNDHRVATVPIPSAGAEHIFFARFVYDDIYFGECTAGFVVRIIPNNPDPEPIAAPDDYTSRTERGAWTAPKLRDRQPV